jgi:hypothetical protein
VARSSGTSDASPSCSSIGTGGGRPGRSSSGDVISSQVMVCSRIIQGSAAQAPGPAAVTSQDPDRDQARTTNAYPPPPLPAQRRP